MLVKFYPCKKWVLQFIPQRVIKSQALAVFIA
jgi:ribonuclease HI